MSIILDALKKLERRQGHPQEAHPHRTPLSPPSAPLPKPPASYRRPTINPPFRLISFKKNLVGIDIGSSSIKVVKLRCRDRSCLLVNAGYLRLPAEVTAAGLAGRLKALVKSRGIGGRVASAIAGRSLTFSHIKLPKMPMHDLTEAVKWEVKKGIDFADDAVIDFVINDETREEGKTVLSILAFAIKKEEVMEHAGILKEAALIPDAVDVGPMALLSAFDHNYGWETDKRYALLDLGASKTTLAIVSDGRLRFTRYIPIGGDEITRVIQNAEGIDFQAAEEKKVRCCSAALEDSPEIVQTAVKSFMEGTCTELRLSFKYYQAQLREGSVDGIFLSGGCSMIKGISDYIGNALGAPTAVYDTLRRVEVKGGLPEDVGLPLQSPLFTEAFGLALRREGE